ncbi:hypothetical protein M0812_10641 [Anaeramoeba flamelloides]|uniref:Uncharacterized protein n=1 Tax=Anaeramoeba flamelloides TaxID=1746091 RepID=A0AAV7ZWG2_9EUKA|nr:hypothetical protein M0812_10641 [Anaeramoeba flamelloides]
MNKYLNEESILVELSLALVLFKNKYQKTHAHKDLDHTKLGSFANSVCAQTVKEMVSLQPVKDLKKNYNLNLPTKKRRNKLLLIKKKNISNKECPTSKKYTYEDLKTFLHMKPRPSWLKRLETFYLYNPQLLVGWKKNYFKSSSPDGEKPKKIAVSKKLFRIFSNLTKKSTSKKDFLRVYKSSQRGVEEFFRKVGYMKEPNYSRKTVIFVLK